MQFEGRCLITLGTTSGAWTFEKVYATAGSVQQPEIKKLLYRTAAFLCFEAFISRQMLRSRRTAVLFF
jgi:hypothetical protein